MSKPTSNRPGKDAKRNDPKRILHIQLAVIAVLGEKRMTLGEVVKLNVGSIVQLEKPADDLLDLMVNDQRLGRGRTVRIGENFGLRLVEIGTVHETIRKLGGPAEAESDSAADPQSAPEAQSERPPTENHPD